MKQIGMFVIAILVAVVAAADPASAVFKEKDGVAIRGYDTVAYFEQGKPVKGTPEFEYEWMGARWRFSSAANRDLFAKDPAKYAPRYGGYCAYGVVHGHLSPIDPSAWKIVEGKLYLNYDREVQDLWNKDIPGNILKAEKIWPELIKTSK